MGFRDIFGHRSERFWSEAAYQRAMMDQAAMVPGTLDRLIDLGVSSEDRMKLEYYFYTNEARKASDLSGELAQLGYEVERRPSTARSQQFVITGWTVPMQMAEDVVTAWIRKMCRLGHKYDCEFDGWGTSPAQ